MGYAVKLQSREIPTINTGIRLYYNNIKYPNTITFKINNGLVVGYYSGTDTYLRQYGNGSLKFMNGVLTANIRIPNQPFSQYMPYTYSSDHTLTINVTATSYYFCLDVCIVD